MAVELVSNAVAVRRGGLIILNVALLPTSIRIEVTDQPGLRNYDVEDKPDRELVYRRQVLSCSQVMMVSR